MGNELTAGHGLSLKKQIASAGPGHLWKIYEASKEESGRGGSGQQLVSLWVFDKKEYAQDRTKLETLLLKLKNGYQHLSRLKHPNILRVLSPLRDDRHYLSFETEPVFSSLSNALFKNYANLASPGYHVEQWQGELLELKMGLFQVASALQFLHRSANLIHLNIAPESVMIGADGAWKLAGFEFAFFSNYKPGGAASADQFHTNEFDSKATFTAATLPNLDYLAPEAVFSRRVDYASDVFAFGVLIYNMHGGGRLIQSQNNVLTYKQRIEHFLPLDLSRVAPDGHETLTEMLAVDVQKRWDADRVLASQFFADILLRSLIFADSLANKDPPLKAKFFKGLARLLPKYSPRLLKLRLLPPLLRELRSVEQVPFVLPSLFALCKLALTDREFRDLVLPSCLPLFNVNGPNAVQIAVSLLENVEFFIVKAPEPVVASHVVPLLAWALGSGETNLQDAAVRQIPLVGARIPYSPLIGTILPLVIKIATGSAVVPPLVRSNALICLGKLFLSKVVDQKIVAEKILPALELSLVNHCTPDIFQSNVRVYLVISKKLDEELVTRKVLPTIMPLLADPILERDLFEKLVELIQELVARVSAWRMNTYLTAEQLEREISMSLSETDELNRLGALVSDAAQQQLHKPPGHDRPRPAASSPPADQPPRSADDMQYEYAKKRDEVFRKKLVIDASHAVKHAQLEQSLSQPSDQQPKQQHSEYDLNDPYSASASASSSPFGFTSPFTAKPVADIAPARPVAPSPTPAAMPPMRPPTVDTLRSVEAPSIRPVAVADQLRPTAVPTTEQPRQAAASLTPPNSFDMRPAVTTLEMPAMRPAAIGLAATGLNPPATTGLAATGLNPPATTGLAATSLSPPATIGLAATGLNPPATTSLNPPASFEMRPATTSFDMRPATTSFDMPAMRPAAVEPRKPAEAMLAPPTQVAATQMSAGSRPEAERAASFAPASTDFFAAAPSAAPADDDSFDFFAGGGASSAPWQQQFDTGFFALQAAGPAPSVTSSLLPAAAAAAPTPAPPSRPAAASFEAAPAISDAEFTLHIDPSFVVHSTADDKNLLDSFFG